MAEHGTTGGYRAHLKRGKSPCAACGEANNAYARRYKGEHGLGRRRLVHVEIVRKRIARLRASGYSVNSLAEAAGLPWQTLTHIVYNADREWVQKRVAAKIFAVEPLTLDGLPDGYHVPAIGTERRLQALAWQGWPMATLAIRLGVNGSALARIINGHRDFVTARTARNVRDLTSALAYQPPPRTLRSRDVTMTLNRARRRGWAPLAAWDDLDDPLEESKGNADAPAQNAG